MGRKVRDGFDDVETLPLIEVGDSAKVQVDMEDRNEDDEFFENEFNEVRSKNTIAQWASDGAMLLITHAQIFLLLFTLSLNLRAPWSYKFTNQFSWLYWLQFDYWSWYKVVSESRLQEKSVWPDDSGYAIVANIPVPYWKLSCVVCAVAVAVFILCVVVFVVISTDDTEGAMRTRAYLVKWYVFTAEATLLPFGAWACRWWWCRHQGAEYQESPKSDVDPTELCLYDSVESIGHVINIAIPTVILLCWLPVPVFIWIQVKKHIFTNSTIEHEGFTLLKETEYIYGINDEWLLTHFFLLSSFRRPHAYARVYMFLIKFAILLIYGLLFDQEKAQAFVYTAFFFVLCGIVVARRPFRLLSYNIILFFSFFVHFWNAFVGACIETETQNAFVQEKYLYYEMMVLNGGFYLITILWGAFLVLRWKKILVRVKRPLWPNLTRTTTVKRDLDEMSRRYLVSIIRAQLTLRETYNTAPLLAPAHELSRRIKILNAYSREAMLHDHVLQHTMWDVTDELIQAHTAVFRKSIFSDCSVHGSRESAKALYAMLPTLAARLRQRDEDLILMSRKRRRILLKMYTLSIFLSRHCERVRRELIAARENRGYETDSDFGDDDDSGVHLRQETLPEMTGGGMEEYLAADSLLLDDSLVLENELIPGLNVTSPAGETVTSPGTMTSPSDGVTASRVLEVSYTSFDNDISNLLDNSIFAGEEQESAEVSLQKQRLQRASFAGVTNSSGLLSPSLDRPFTSPYKSAQKRD